jgi:multiple sugar transport system permease protein
LKSKSRISQYAPYILILPAILLLLVFLLYPVLNVFFFSFQNKVMNRPMNDGYIGLQNFIRIFTEDKVFIETLGNSIRWVVCEVGLQLIFGLSLALLLKRRFKGNGIFRATLFLPWALSGVLVSMLWAMMYYEQVGVLNDILKRIGLISRNIAWTGNMGTAFWSVVVAELWRGIPFFSIMLLASLQSIPEELYEACRVDGANPVTTFIHITLPHIKDTIILTTLLRMVWEFNSVDLIMNLTGGGPIYRTTTLTVYIANTAVKHGDFGYGSALAVISFSFLFVVAALYLKLSQFGQDGDAK